MTFYTRADWGARPPTSQLPKWRGSPIGIAVHYVGGSGPIGLADHAQCLTLVRHLQDYALSGNYRWTYADLEYNVCACPHGHVIDGRGIHVEGAAQLDANDSHVSCLALANVGDPIAGTGLAQGVLDAVAYIQAAYPSATQVVGHRDTAGNPTGTNCPGDLIEAWLHAPHTATPPPAPEEHMSCVWYLNAVHWFWIDAHSQLQHDYGTGIENMSTKYLRGELFDPTRGVHTLVTPTGTLVVGGVTPNGRALELGFAGSWGATAKTGVA